MPIPSTHNPNLGGDLRLHTIISSLCPFKSSQRREKIIRLCHTVQDLTDNPCAVISTTFISQTNPTNGAQDALCILPGSDKEIRYKDEYITTTGKIISHLSQTDTLIYFRRGMAEKLTVWRKMQDRKGNASISHKASQKTMKQP